MRVACLQLTSGPDMGKNIEVGCKFLRVAQDRGAELARMPENVGVLGPGKEMLQQAELDAVCIGLPTWMHAPATRDALECVGLSQLLGSDGMDSLLWLLGCATARDKRPSID